MNFSRFSFKTSIIILTVLISASFAQEADITNQLKYIDEGRYELAIDELNELKSESPNDPSVMYLDALLTADASDAVTKYKTIIEKYPESKYADAANYQVYSYYYSVGNYSSAKKQLENLKKNYPSSIYIRKIEDKIDALSISDLTYKKPVGPTTTNKAEKQSGDKSKGGFSVQAGAFLVKGNAVKLAKSLKSKGFRAEINEKDVGGSNFYIVNVGNFKTSNEAEELAGKIKKALNIEGRIVNLN